MSWLIACDEVGRGAIAGPVVACAVRMRVCEQTNLYLKSLGVKDSKKLSHKQRVQVLAKLGVNKLTRRRKIKIPHLEFEYCISRLSPASVDKMNILNASLEAMKRSALALWTKEEEIFVDGNKAFSIRGHSSQIHAIIKGDDLLVAISLASILAKEFRDEIMGRLHLHYPQYLFEKNSGYPTKEHLMALAEHGACLHHRKTFGGVKQSCFRR